MVIIHDHACSATVKLYAIYDSNKMCRSSSTTTCIGMISCSSITWRSLELCISYG